MEVMARRGRDTLRYGPLKPVGLPDPRTGKEPFAVVQLRKDNAAGTHLQHCGLPDTSDAFRSRSGYSP